MQLLCKNGVKLFLCCLGSSREDALGREEELLKFGLFQLLIIIGIERWEGDTILFWFFPSRRYFRHLKSIPCNLWIAV